MNQNAKLIAMRMIKGQPPQKAPEWVYAMAHELLFWKAQSIRQGIAIEALLDRLKLSAAERRALLASFPKEAA